MTELLLSAEQIAEVEGITYRGALKKYLGLAANLNGTRDVYVREVADSRGGRSGRAYRFDYAKLAEAFPKKVKAEWLAEARERFGGQGALELGEPQGEIAVHEDAILEKQSPLLALVVAAKPEPTEIATLPEARQAMARARYAAIRLAVAPRTEANWRYWLGKAVHGNEIRGVMGFLEALAADSAVAARGETPLLVAWREVETRLRHELEDEKYELIPISAATLRRWHGWYTRGRTVSGAGLAPGIVALHDPQKVTAGNSDYFGRPPSRFPDAAEEIEAELAKLTPAGRLIATLRFEKNWSATDCHRELEQRFAELGMKECPSRGAVSRWLAAWPPAAHTWATGDPVLFHQRHAPYAQRNYLTCEPMDWWVLDHAQCDFDAMNDLPPEMGRLVFPEEPFEKRFRIWVTAFQDVRSRAWLGWAFSVNPSSTAIGSALRMAVMVTGRPPRYGLLDRGEDMKKMGLLDPGQPLAHAGAMARLIKDYWGEDSDSGVVFSIGEHPQSKPIERSFLTQRLKFDRKVLSYCGRSPAHRPARSDELRKLHKNYLAGKASHTMIPRASEAIGALIFYFSEIYNRRHKHRGHGMFNRTPEQVFRAGWSIEQQTAAREQLDPRRLAQFLWSREVKRFSRGCVRAYHTEFAPADSESLARLRAYDGRDVLFACDPHQLGDAAAFDSETGEQIGELESKELMAWGATNDKIRAAMRAQRGMRKALGQYMSAMSAAVAAPSGAFGFLGGTADARAALPAARQTDGGQAAGQRRTGPAFVSDAVEADADVFANIEMED